MNPWMKPPPDPFATRLQPALEALIGQPVAAIDTPALVIDLDAMERNLVRMTEFARSRKVKLRPHAKMHKSAALARLQMQAGAVGVCVQKTSEAEALAAGGVTDLYISNEVIAPAKLRRVAALARQLNAAGGRLAVAVDSLEGIARLAAAMAESVQGVSGPVATRAHDEAPASRIDVFIEIDVGQGRCGVPPGEAAVALAQAITGQNALRFAGLQAYHGRAQHLRTLSERRDAIANATDAVRRTREAIVAAGIEVALVTGAGTGTFALESASGVWGELQAGSYLFMDADYAQNAKDPAQPQVPIVAGNIATPEGVRDLAEAGASAVKIGVGSGSICITRLVTGFGVPQLTALLECAEVAHTLGIPLIADGGIRNSGDIAKALAAGASTVMLGGMLAGTDEAPGATVSRDGKKAKIVRGMASLTANIDRLQLERGGDMDPGEWERVVPEGIEAVVPYRGAVSDIVQQLMRRLAAVKTI